MRASTARSNRSRWRIASAAVLPLALAGALAGAPLVAQAAPSPVSGASAGGTQVTLDSLSLSFTQVSTGQDISLATGDDGKTYAWGSNDFGELGNNNPGTSSAVPVEVPTAATVTPVTFDGVAGTGIAYNAVLDRWTVGRSPRRRMRPGQSTLSSTMTGSALRKHPSFSPRDSPTLPNLPPPVLTHRDC